VTLIAADVLAWNLMDTGRLEDAQRIVDDGLVLIQQRMRDDPNPAWQFWHVVFQNSASAFAMYHQRFEEAAMLARASIAECEHLRALQPRIVWHPRKAGDSHFRLGEALVALDEFAEAESAFRAAMHHWKSAGAPADVYFAAQAQFRLGEVLHRLSRTREAEAELTAAIDRFAKFTASLPREPYCNRRLVIALTMCPVESLRDAEDALVLAERILPEEDGLYWRYIALARYRVGDWQGAFEAATQAMARRAGGDAMEWLLAALARWRGGQEEDARNWYTRAKLALEHEEPIYFYEIGYLGYHQLLEEAAALMDRVTEVQSGASS
jgi:tetratricopeptide (TPR) repeat protein